MSWQKTMLYIYQVTSRRNMWSISTSWSFWSVVLENPVHNSKTLQTKHWQALRIEYWQTLQWSGYIEMKWITPLGLLTLGLQHCRFSWSPVWHEARSLAQALEWCAAAQGKCGQGGEEGADGHRRQWEEIKHTDEERPNICRSMSTTQT